MRGTSDLLAETICANMVFKTDVSFVSSKEKLSNRSISEILESLEFTLPADDKDQTFIWQILMVKVYEVTAISILVP